VRRCVRKAHVTQVRSSNCSATALATQRPRAGNKKVRLSFKLPYRTHFGQDICIVGSSDALGAWDPSKGVGLRWSEGDVWEVDFEVSAG
jgi:hypothetical protein